MFSISALALVGRGLVKTLTFLWGTVAFIFGVITFAPLGDLGWLFAIFGSPVAIFIAPLCFGLFGRGWAPALMLYGSLMAVLLLNVAIDLALARHTPGVTAQLDTSRENCVDPETTVGIPGAWNGDDLPGFSPSRDNA